MKKLSLKENKNERVVYTLSAPVENTVYMDDFSGFNSGEELIRGACCNCSQRYCSRYTSNELHSELFAAFPKNTSNRVCPTDAIDFDETGCAYINSDSCINCGLCVHRCPFAAIQFSPKKHTCQINTERQLSYKECSSNDQQLVINDLFAIKKVVSYTGISKSFASTLADKMKVNTNAFPDLSEIVVRNSFLNAGLICNTNAAGNNHFRVEFFAESNDKIIIGESEITNTDTLSVTRRILDDIAVLIGRYGFTSNQILPLAVINGLPNKRTDYYEVVEDIYNVLGVQICTITYHALFMLNLYHVGINADILSRFIINRQKDMLIPYMRAIIPNIERIDNNTDTFFYSTMK